MAHSHSHEHDLIDIRAKLRGKDRRITKPREEILELLGKEEHPVTARTLHEKLSKSCDLVTVYRSLKMLESMHLVKRFDFGDNTARYELICPDDHGHHHHLICRECRTVVEIEECFDSELESKIAKKHGFKNVTHQLEFFGLCSSCQTA
tara:strand:- start:1162 stop:1608 length:447 start_codon:yes stop_codon:yes gene_type:complete